MTDFKAKMHQIRFRLGLRLRPRWGSLQRSPRPPNWIWGLLLRRGKGREGRRGEGRRGKGRGGEGRKGKGREGKERAMSPPPTIWRKFTPMVPPYLQILATPLRASDCMLVNPCSKSKMIPYSMVREIEKWSELGLDRHQNLITSWGSPLCLCLSCLVDVR